MILKFDQFVLEKLMPSMVPKASPNASVLVKKVEDDGIDLTQAATDCFNWWKGSFMRSDDKDSDVIKAIKDFRAVGKVYHKPINTKFYRAVHLRVSDNDTEETIRKMTNGTLSNKLLQSWATSHDGAKYFFDTFCVKGNFDAEPVSGKAWVIVESDGKDLEQLLTLTEAIQFIVDAATTYPGSDKKGKTIDDTSDRYFINRIAFFLADEQLFKLHELICECKVPEPTFKVVDVLVLPKK